MRGGGLAAGAASLVCLFWSGPFLATGTGFSGRPARSAWPLRSGVASDASDSRFQGSFGPYWGEQAKFSLDRRTGVRVEHTFVNDRVSSHSRVRVACSAEGAACARAAACRARAGGRRRASARACDGGRRGRRGAVGNAAGGGALAFPGYFGRREGL